MKIGSRRTPSSNSPTLLLRARWLATMCGPIIDDGAVVISENKIVATGQTADLKRAFTNLTIRDFGHAVILPGLVNAHVHLELSDLTPPPGPNRLTDWLGAVVKQAAPIGEAGRPRIEAATKIGIAESLGFGVTCVGDISNRSAVTRKVLAEQSDGGEKTLRAISFGEVLAMAARRHLLPQRLADAVDQTWKSDRLGIGVSPHAPYSVESNGYAECLTIAKSLGMPLATHLAESDDESRFLEHAAGPFRDLWNAIGGWDNDVPRFAGGPIRFAHSLGLLDYAGTVLAHVNYCDDAELALLADGKASVVVCPRTHDYFNHPPHRWKEMLTHGINVAVGTDSKGSSPNLNLVDDLRQMHQWSPEVPAEVLWEMATVRGARALGLSHTAGILAPGRDADVCIFPTEGNRPLDDILNFSIDQTNNAPTVMANGVIIR